MDTVAWGIIGCGDVTEVKSGPALRKTANASLVAVMRRDAGKARDYAERHGVPRWYDDAQALIDDPEVSAIYVATPPDTHEVYTVAAARAGKPVLVEKPMAPDAAACRRMIDACARAGVPLFVAYYRRALPRFEAMRRLIQSGAIGAPRVVSIRHFLREGQMPAQPWKVDPTVNGGGFFVDMQSHTLDWLDHVFGPAEAARGIAVHQAGRYAAEDAVSFSLRFGGGVIANGLCGYATAREEEGVTVYGSEGEVSMPFFRPGPLRLVTGTGEVCTEHPDPPHVHQPLIASVVAHLLGQGVCASTGESALRTTRVIDAILADLSTR
ncbi:MAG: Gfo/Idh/MocA family oxidoreductase [Rhodothermales bacterium]